MRILPIVLAGALSAPASAEPCRIDPGAGLPSYEARCQQIQVPVDHQRPDGEQLTLMLAIIPADEPQPLPDPMVVIPGGPGQSATASWPMLRGALAGLQRARDIWLLDPRGTGRSQPLDCELPEVEPWLSSDPEAAVRLIRQCRDRLLAEGRRLAHYTTADLVADLEIVRQRQGAPSLNLYAGSYGTRVALEYLRRHGDAVRSAVLDGVVPPSLALGQDHARNLDEALAAWFAQCRADADCRERHGDPAQWLATLRARLAEGPRPVRLADPMTHEMRELPLNHDLLAGVLRMYAYAPETAVLLPLLLAQADRRPELLVSQGLMIASQMQGMIHMGMSMAVSCSEDAPLLRRDPADRERLLGQSLVSFLIRACEDWPVRPPPADFREPVRSQVPVLLLSGERDPVTPPRYADALLPHLARARHLVARGQGHIVAPRGCMPRLITTFVEKADPQAPDAECLDSLDAPAIFLDFNGPAP